MTEKHVNPEDFDLHALGALEGEEKRVLEQHAGACPRCRQALAEARQRVALLGLASAPVAPPPSVKSTLMQRIHAEASMNRQQPVSTQPAKKRWGLRFALGFAAATAILAYATFWLARDDSQNRHQIQQLHAQLEAAQAAAAKDDAAMRAYAEVVAAPDTVSVTLQQQPGGPPGQAHVLYNGRMGLAVYSGQISPPPAGKSYQLWLVPASGSPVNAGLVAANQENGAAVVHLAPNLTAKAFAVTVEPVGGSPQPTGPKVLVGAPAA